MTLLLALAVAACAGPARDHATGSAGRRAVVAGRVTLGPQCPVERQGSPCPSTPPVGTVVVVTGRGGGVDGQVSRATTRADGTFRVAVAPGRYLVTATVGMSCVEADAVARPRATAHVVVRCDTGIR